MRIKIIITTTDEQAQWEETYKSPSFRALTEALESAVKEYNATIRTAGGATGKMLSYAIAADLT